ncbi:MAG: hypothetical protein OXM61_16910 [Candidatus Poribacteria bacterium]|nr:hypothetical protein [Candidatus Poribacteria bacterium]
MKQLLAISIIVFIFVGNAYAPDVQKFKVYVGIKRDVPDEEKTEKDIVETHLKRELRALGDVKIVNFEDDWQFRITVGALGHENKDGSKRTTLSIAYAFERRVPKSYFKSYNFIDPPVYSGNIGMANWSRDNLPALCILIAGTFDKNILNLYR